MERDESISESNLTTAWLHRPGLEVAMNGWDRNVAKFCLAPLLVLLLIIPSCGSKLVNNSVEDEEWHATSAVPSADLEDPAVSSGKSMNTQLFGSPVQAKASARVFPEQFTIVLERYAVGEVSKGGPDLKPEYLLLIFPPEGRPSTRLMVPVTRNGNVYEAKIDKAIGFNEALCFLIIFERAWRTWSIAKWFWPVELPSLYELSDDRYRVHYNTAFCGECPVCNLL